MPGRDVCTSPDAFHVRFQGTGTLPRRSGAGGPAPGWQAVCKPRRASAQLKCVLFFKEHVHFRLPNAMKGHEVFSEPACTGMFLNLEL